MAVVIFTTGASGAGKTYARCARFVVDRFFQDYRGRHISNFPIKHGPMVELAAARNRLTPVEVAERIETLPESVLESWEPDGKKDASGPWEYFAGVDLEGCHVAIDEVHRYCPIKNPDHARLWSKWLGQIRHKGCTVELISQHPNKVARILLDEAELHYTLVNAEDWRDPWCGILRRDWYAIRARLTGEYLSYVVQVEKRRVDGKLVKQDQTWWLLDERYFGVYDSYSAPEKGDAKAKGLERPHERHKGVLLWLWFLGRNWPRLLSRFAVVAFLVFLMSGGGRILIGGLLAYFTLFANGNKADAEAVELAAELTASAAPGDEPVVKPEYQAAEVKLDLVDEYGQPLLFPGATLEDLVNEYKAMRESITAYGLDAAPRAPRADGVEVGEAEAGGGALGRGAGPGGRAASGEAESGGETLTGLIGESAYLTGGVRVRIGEYVSDGILRGIRLDEIDLESGIAVFGGGLRFGVGDRLQPPAEYAGRRVRSRVGKPIIRGGGDPDGVVGAERSGPAVLNAAAGNASAGLRGDDGPRGGDIAGVE